ncbi:MAG: preprotein translocase subunit SecG [Methylococcaceae bacterium]
MYQVIIVIHVLLGLGIIGLIMMQQGKGADAGAAFGTGSSGSVFGAQGAASFLSRTTAIMAALFFITSLGLAVLNSKQGAAYDLMNPSVVEQETSGIPDVEGAKGVESTPAVTPEELPVTPEVTGAEQPVKTPVSEREIKDTVVPKAEEMKPVEEKPAVPSKSKNK